MNNNDKEFQKAQEVYDNQTPPDAEVNFFEYQKKKLGYVRYTLEAFHDRHIIVGHTKAGYVTRTIQRFENKKAAMAACNEFMKRELTIWPIGGIVSAPQSPS
jgi:hypothetical protein